MLNIIQYITQIHFEIAKMALSCEKIQIMGITDMNLTAHFFLYHLNVKKSFECSDLPI